MIYKCAFSVALLYGSARGRGDLVLLALLGVHEGGTETRGSGLDAHSAGSMDPS